MGIAPTGSGKTLIAREIINRTLKDGEKALILSHTRDIVNQTIRSLGPDCNNVTVCTWQKAVRNEKILLTPYKMVIVDEAHLFITPYTLALMRHYRDVHKSFILGLTATPHRDDGRPLDIFFKKTAFDISAKVLRRKGWLAKPKQKKVFADDARQVYKTWKKLAGDRKTICFCNRVWVAREFALLFRQYGIDAGVVSGNTPDEDREMIKQECQVIFNVNVFAEGSDIPNVGCVMEIMPAKGLTRFRQRAGRGLRPDTKDCIIIRFNLGSDNFDFNVE